ALRRIDAVFPAGPVGHDPRDRGAIAAPEEGLHALCRRSGSIDGGKLDLLADLLAQTRRQGLDRLLHGIRAIDALRPGRGELLRLLARGQRRPQLEPARFFAHLADGAIYFAVDEVVDVASAPLIANQRLVIDLGKPRVQSLPRQLLNRRTE